MALANKDSVLHFRDSINTIKNGQQFENSKLKFELLNSQHSLSLNEAQLSSQRTVTIYGPGIYCSDHYRILYLADAH